LTSSSGASPTNTKKKRKKEQAKSYKASDGMQKDGGKNPFVRGGERKTARWGERRGFSSSKKVEELGHVGAGGAHQKFSSGRGGGGSIILPKRRGEKRNSQWSGKGEISSWGDAARSKGGGRICCRGKRSHNGGERRGQVLLSPRKKKIYFPSAIEGRKEA